MLACFSLFHHPRCLVFKFWLARQRCGCEFISYAAAVKAAAVPAQNGLYTMYPHHHTSGETRSPKSILLRAPGC
jgi:hypothetical protein